MAILTLDNIPVLPMLTCPYRVNTVSLEFTMENRRSLRFDVELACRLRWGHVAESVNGITQNISRSGALIWCWPGPKDGGVPRVGDSLEMNILLPHSNVFGQKALHCRTVVVRVDRNLAGACEIALSFEQLRFQEARPPARFRTAGRMQEAIRDESAN